MGIFSDDRANELRALFFESAQEILQALNDDALRLEKAPRDPEIVRDLRRSVHTLKGDAAACGYTDLSTLAHAMEDVLAPAVAERDPDGVVELVLIAADAFDNLLTAYRNHTDPPSTAPLYEKIARLRNPVPVPAFTPEFSWSAAELEEMREAASAKPVWQIALGIDSVCAMPAAALQLAHNVLASTGALLAIHPGATKPGAPETIVAALATEAPLEDLARKLKIPAVIANVHLTAFDPAALVELPVAEAAPQVPSTPAPEAPASVPAANSSQTEHRARDERMAPSENMLRVETERVDTVLDLVGELIIAKSMMHEAVAEMARHLAPGPLRTRATDTLTLQSQILHKLQRAVMKIRMVPVEQMFRRLPRVARDTARAVGHEVNVVIEGGNTDLDKSILDALAEPMMHLLRNAIDHGIEPPEERQRLGKPTEGTIRLDAYHQGNQVVIEISDDGRGIDTARVIQSAIDRGILRPDQAAHLPDEDALDLIFQAGLSTAAKITAISGRGVGMDVVKAVMDRLKGTINVRTTPGQGTTFRLKVPLTLAIIKALLFRINERLYAVPLASVVEILRAQEEEVHLVDNQEVLQVREQFVPLIRLRRIHPGGERRSKIFVIVVNVGDHLWGLVVDRLIGEQELVIKALDEHTINTEIVSGASILGDGRVVLVLGVAEIVEKLGRGQFTSSLRKAEGVQK
ncbi:MAG: chemotaxis protein CheA [Acidobacteriota bacterium]|nr:chemotaxis protein CheA [Acidobacteriota bacterium]